MAYLKSEQADVDSVDFNFLATALEIQAGDNFAGLRENESVLEILDFGIELLARLEHQADKDSPETRERLIRLKDKLADA